MKTNSSCASVLAATMIGQAAPLPNTYRVYFGTTAKEHQRGIYTALFDTQTGQLSEAVRLTDSVRPGFVVIHPEGRHLYATEATGSAAVSGSGYVSAYRIEESGKLTALNTQPSGGEGPCHISIVPGGKQLLTANYRGGSCATLPILGNGELGEPSATRQHEGSGPNTKRQEKAHTHSFNSDPDGAFALAADLGMDQILIYALDSGALNLAGQTATAPGAGPRHLAFSPCGRFVYVCMELNGTVSAYRYENGSLEELQTLPTLPGDFKDQNTVSEVCITPDGRFLYVGNRGHESLAIFEVDPESGRLTARGHQSTLGKHPRHFNIDPSGRFLIAANMHSDNVVVFRIDRKTGKLEYTGSEISVPAPSCVQFFAIPE